MLNGKRLLTGAMLLALTASCVFSQENTPAAPPSPKMLEGLSPEAVLALADTWGTEYESSKVTIWTTSREFHFEFPDGSKTVIAMPDDRMVVSVAPYIMKTHPCKEHFPSTCRGELANTPVTIRAVASDGTVILEQNTRTLANGFVDLWLPRDRQIDVSMVARGLKVTQRIGTFDTDKTCITEPKLHY